MKKISLFEEALKKVKKKYSLSDKSVEEEGEGGAPAAGGAVAGGAAIGSGEAAPAGGAPSSGDGGDTPLVDVDAPVEDVTPDAPKPKPLPPPCPHGAGIGWGVLGPLVRWPFAVRTQPTTTKKRKKKKKTSKKKK